MISLFSSASMLIGHSWHSNDRAFPIADQPLQQRERPDAKPGALGLLLDWRAAQTEQLRRLLGC